MGGGRGVGPAPVRAGRARRAGHPRFPRWRAAHQSLRDPARDRARRRHRRRGRHPHRILNHNERHAVDAGRCGIFRALRLRRDGEPRWHRRRPRPAAAHQGRARHLRQGDRQRAAAAGAPAPHAGIGACDRDAGQSGTARHPRSFHRPRVPHGRLLAHAQRADPARRDAGAGSRPAARGNDRLRPRVRTSYAGWGELSVRQHAHRARRDSPRHAPTVPLRGRRRLLRRFRLRRAVRMPPLRRGRSRLHGPCERGGRSRAAAPLARAAHGRPPGTLSQLLGALPLRRRLPLRGDPSRPARVRLYPRLARLCAPRLCAALGAAARPAGTQRPRRASLCRRADRGRLPLKRAMTPDVAAEICILGGGPAGAVVARRLAELGHDTLLVDRADEDGPARAESLAPSILPILESLQLRAEVEAATFGREHLALVRWVSSAIVDKEVAGAPALLIERTQFDKRLRGAAARAGVRLMPAARARAPRRLPSGGWAVPVATAQGETLVTAGFLVDARGKRRRTGKEDGAPGTAAITAAWAPADRSFVETRIEAGSDAWFWGSPLPGGAYAATIFLDAERMAGVSTASRAVCYRRLLAQSQLLGRLLRGKMLGPVRVCDATGRMSPDLIGHNFIRVGEAAVAIDPLSSQGIQDAILSAIQASAAVHTLLTAADSIPALESYRDRRQAARSEERRVGKEG